MTVKHKNNPDLSLLPKIFSGYSGILAVYLFGSTGKGSSHYSKIIRQYLDFLPYLEVQRAAYKRRISDGQA